jgi:hypothetical protein
MTTIDPEVTALGRCDFDSAESLRQFSNPPREVKKLLGAVLSSPGP